MCSYFVFMRRKMIMNKALLVIDMQNGVCLDKIFNLNSVIININNRIEYFRDHNLPIIFIQHNDQDLQPESDDWEIMKSIEYVKGKDIVVQKIHADSFYKTNLKSKLDQLKVDELEITGAQVEYCVDTTIRVAHNLKYKITMHKGTVTTFDNEFLPASKMIDYYYKMWDQRFLILK